MPADTEVAEELSNFLNRQSSRASVNVKVMTTGGAGGRLHSIELGDEDAAIQNKLPVSFSGCSWV